MHRNTRRHLAALLAFFIVLQPFVSVAMFPVIDMVAYADKIDEEKEKPRPGVRNSDHRMNRVSPGNEFPSLGSSQVPTFGNTYNPGDRSGGTPEETGHVDIIQPNDQDIPAPDKQGSNGNDPTTGGKENQIPGGEQSVGGDDPKSDGSLDDPSGDDHGATPGKGDSNNQGDVEGQNEQPTGKENRNQQETNLPEVLEGIKEQVELVTDGVTFGELIEPLLNGDMTASEFIFLIGQLEFENEAVQAFYDDLISEISKIHDLGKELSFINDFRGNESLKFLDWLKPSTYVGLIYGHTKDLIENGKNYRSKYTDSKSSHVKAEDKGKLKLSNILNWVGEGFERVTEFGKKTGSFITSGIDRVNHFLGNGLTNVADKAQSFFSGKLEDARKFGEIVSMAKDNVKSSFAKNFFGALDKVSSAVSRGFSMLSSTAEKIGKIGKWFSKSNITQTAKNALTIVQGFATNAKNWGLNAFDKVKNSKVVSGMKKLANSPIGKLGSGVLSGLSIGTGILDLVGDGSWNIKVSGGLSIVSGGLGIAAIAAASTVAAPFLVGGAVVTGIGALGFTYGPKIVSAWNNSRFGSAVNNAVSTGYRATRDAVTNVANFVTETGRNIVNGIASGIGSLFGSR